MNLASFRQSLIARSPPADLDHALQALWWDAKGDWGKAHDCAQAQEDATGAWVHAYLHRKEGDLANARYWYREAKQKPAEGALDDEWAVIAGALLDRTSKD